MGSVNRSLRVTSSALSVLGLPLLLLACGDDPAAPAPGSTQGTAMGVSTTGGVSATGDITGATAQATSSTGAGTTTTLTSTTGAVMATTGAIATTSGVSTTSSDVDTATTSAASSTGAADGTANTTGAGGTTSTGGDSTTSASVTTGGPMPSSGCGLEAETGTYEGTVEAFGLERTYLMSVPDSYDASVPQRLVFGYHGSNYTGELMRQYLQLEEPPLLEGTVFVYPDGIPLEGQPDHVAWELGAEDRDIAFFDALFEQLKAQFCIDESRVFVNGQSFGGLMTNAVGCHRGEVVRAIAVVAGSGPRGSTCNGQVAAWLTHGVDDESVSYSSGEGSRDHWVTANHCQDTTLPGTPAQCQEYQGCDSGFPVIWCPHENDGGHQHPSFGREAVRDFLASF